MVGNGDGDGGSGSGGGSANGDGTGGLKRTKYSRNHANLDGSWGSVLLFVWWVLLFPEEGWARSASSSYWTLTPFWWSRSRCKVVEVAGTRRYSTQAKMVDTGTGTLYIIGSFKRMTTDPDFKLYLTSNVSSSDFNMGYSMTGTLERGCKKTNSFQMTHFAVIRRRDYEKAYEDPNPT
ncbi:hypothetical protein M0802_001776 [Mischocyttarus mexicanus]|nr:hypothetical protein M0802_001776 [Mischocyttarus mexicanus]